MEIADYAELSAHLDKVISGLASFVLSRTRDMLSAVKEVDQGQREAFLYILEFLQSRGVSVVDVFQNLSPESISVIGVDGLNLLIQELSEGSTAAIIALGDLGDERGYLPLVMLFRNLTPEEAPAIYETEGRRARMDAMEKLKNKLTTKSVEPLIKALEDPMMEVERWAMEGLAAIGDERAINPLIRILFDEKRMWGREDVARALGKIGSEKAIDALIQAYKKA